MSQQLFKNDVLFYQRLLSCAGFYTDTLDGDWGKNTDAADKAFEAKSNQIATSLGIFDQRTERNIRALLPVAQDAARKSLKKMIGAGIDARIISGTRTYAEQNALFRQGRFGNAGPIVTNARGGFSWHNFGLAWDIGIFTASGQYQTTSAPYNAASVHAIIPGLQWGGNWVSFKDPPHYQTAPAGQSISQARAHFESGGRG
jgi:peptidoglycan LD-endopeptidase CwlK